MKLRNITILLCAVIAVVIGGAYFIRDRDSDNIGDAGSDTEGIPSASADDPPRPSKTGSIYTITTPQQTASKQPVDWNRLAALSEGNVGTLPKLATADCEHFLAKNGETPANLIAVFDQTGDRKWLERSLAAFPDSPLVLFQALADSPNASAEQRTAWLEKLKESDPNNPVAWLFSAEALFKSGHSKEGAAEASAALERPGFYTYFAERIAATRALYEDSGMHPLDAELLATFSLKMQLLQTAQQTGLGLEAMKNAEGAERAVIAEAARIQYGLGRMFQTPEASRTLIGQLVGISLETKGLGSQPTELQEKRKAEIESQKAEIRELTKAANDLLISKDEDQLTEYLRRFRTEGELATLRWLKAQSAK